ncbi:MAG TPA: DUF2461 domain-containing protein, partial [Kineosporiaceae bacterium]|jgi:uncharacterized protein (TIGR02453 family)|nr:DUF2461 domain-containing protein [Kineosporiaceae bacterium]
MADSTATRGGTGTSIDTSAAFTGFDGDALGFYDGLEADNSKTYWTDHKAIYEQAVRTPMLALLAPLEPRFGPATMFRPYRDVRFSADKSPYKTHAGAVLRAAGGTQLYVQVGADGLLVGGGYYHMSPDQLSRYRQAVDDDGPGRRLERVAAKLGRAGFTLIGERLARAPRGVDPKHPRIDLLRHKGLAAMFTFGVPDWLGTPRCLDEVAGAFRSIAPLTGWLAEQVGPAEPSDGDPRRVRRAAGS